MQFIEDRLIQAVSMSKGNDELAAALSSFVIVLASGVYEDYVGV